MTIEDEVKAAMTMAREPILIYCDYIADALRQALVERASSSADLVRDVGQIKADLHPRGGWMVSTKKTMSVTDKNGTIYRVTVEEQFP